MPEHWGVFFQLHGILDQYLKTDGHLWDSHTLNFVAFVVVSKIPPLITGDVDSVMGFSLLMPLFLFTICA